MPTVARIGPYRFFFYSNERNEPPHIHVRHDAMLAKFWLNPQELASSTEFSPTELNRPHAIIDENRSLFLQAWSDYFSE